MTTLGKYEIASTRNPKNPLLHRLRIRLNGVLVGECFPALTDPDMIGHSDPRKFVAQYPLSKARKVLVKQLLQNNISLADVEMLTAMPERKTK